MIGEIVTRKYTPAIADAAEGDPIYVEDLDDVRVMVHPTDSIDADLDDVAAQVQWSPDGVDWFNVGSAITEDSTFPVTVPLVSGAKLNDMPAKYVRLSVGTFLDYEYEEGLADLEFTVIGRRRNGFA